MKRKRPRYTRREQILAEMDKARKMADGLDGQSIAIKHQAYIEAKKVDSDPESENAEWWRKQSNWHLSKAEELAGKANSLRTNRIQKLREKLSEFDTKVLPGIIEDESIEV